MKRVRLRARPHGARAGSHTRHIGRHDVTGIPRKVPISLSRLLYSSSRLLCGEHRAANSFDSVLSVNCKVAVAHVYSFMPEPHMDMLTYLDRRRADSETKRVAQRCAMAERRHVGSSRHPTNPDAATRAPRVRIRGGAVVDTLKASRPWPGACSRGCMRRPRG